MKKCFAKVMDKKMMIKEKILFIIYLGIYILLFSFIYQSSLNTEKLLTDGVTKSYNNDSITTLYSHKHVNAKLKCHLFL